MNPNATKVWLFIFSLCLSMLILGENFGGRPGLLLGFLAALSLNIFIFLWGESRILSLFETRSLRGQDSWGLSKINSELCRLLNIDEPQIYVIQTHSASAFSVGFTTKRSSICLTSGLLDRLSSSELRAVLAHQLCHIARMNSFSYSVSSLMANMILGLAQALDSIWPLNFVFEKKQRPFLTLFSPIGWLLIRGIVQKSSFYENDKEAARLIQNKNRMGEVLWKLNALAQTLPLTVPPGASHLFIVEPEGLRNRNYFLKFHPRLEDRLRELIGMPTV